MPVPIGEYCRRGHLTSEFRRQRAGRKNSSDCSICKNYVWDDNDEPLMCDLESCLSFARRRTTGLCYTHHKRFTANGTTDPVGLKRAAWGSGYVNSEGYVEIWVAAVKYHEHRWAMESHLGRDLLPHENVHHINGDRADNRIENLELWSTSQPSGQRISDKIKWATEFLAEYGYRVDEPSKQRSA